MSTCPTCGSEHDTVAGMKRHHALSHGESIAGVEVECFTCSKTMRVRPYRAKKYDTFACSNECEREMHRDRSTTGVNMNEYECTNCGESVERYESQVVSDVYCSRSCATSATMGTGSDHPRYNTITVQCPVCSSGFDRCVSAVEYFDNAYCSRGCADKAHSERVSGVDNPNYKHGLSDTAKYGPNWGARRSEVLDRDGHKCQRCGMGVAEHKEQYGRSLDIHHKTPAVQFDTPEKANVLSNLVALCQPCHGYVEHN